MDFATVFLQQWQNDNFACMVFDIHGLSGELRLVFGSRYLDETNAGISRKCE
jgi:hypothetical protein